MENKDLLDKARQANSPEELLAIAKENDYPLDAEEAKTLFERLHNSGELSDDELDNVSGGGCHAKDGRLIVTTRYACEEFRCKACGKRIGAQRKCLNNKYHRCSASDGMGWDNCDNCMNCSYEHGIWYCNHPTNRK